MGLTATYRVIPSIVLVVSIIGMQLDLERHSIGTVPELIAADTLPGGWRHVEFKDKRATQYDWIQEDGRGMVKAESRSAQSGLGRIVSVEPDPELHLNWDWKVNNVLKRGDLANKIRDDAPARIYLMFEYDPSDLPFLEYLKYKTLRALGYSDIPLRALNYTWANRAERGSLFSNPYTDWVKVIAVESGEDHINTWRSESRNIYDDFKTAFGEEPGRITHIMVMTDTDNTGSRATAFYGDITFSR